MDIKKMGELEVFLGSLGFVGSFIIGCGIGGEGIDWSFVKKGELDDQVSRAICFDDVPGFPLRSWPAGQDHPMIPLRIVAPDGTLFIFRWARILNLFGEKKLKVHATIIPPGDDKDFWDHWLTVPELSQLWEKHNKKEVKMEQK
jgi:hypothetical protein